MMVGRRVAAAVSAVAVAGVLAGCGGSGSGSDASTAAPDAVRSQLAAAAGISGTDGVSTIVTAKGPRLAVYPNPLGASATSSLSNPNEAGAPRVLLVVSSLPGWFRVLLPVRPNGTMGWVKSTDVTASRTGYHLTVSRSAHVLTVYNGKTVVRKVPVAIGTSDTPTPGGQFYITELLQPTNPAGPYGPYAFGLSGYSTTLASFDGQAPVIGLHGTNQPAYIGHDVSHGCVRMSNANIRVLAAMLPLGTPVSIAA